MLLNELNQTILIAEDDNMNFRYLEVLLSKKTSLTLLRAKNGAEAVQLAKENPQISLILMDIQLPIMTGYEAVIEIRKFSDVPIVAQTANAMSEDRIRCMKAGCTAFITKPIDMDTLLDTIQSVLSDASIQ